MRLIVADVYGVKTDDPLRELPPGRMHTTTWNETNGYALIDKVRSGEVSDFSLRTITDEERNAYVKGDGSVLLTPLEDIDFGKYGRFQTRAHNTLVNHIGVNNDRFRDKRLYPELKKRGISIDAIVGSNDEFPKLIDVVDVYAAAMLTGGVLRILQYGHDTNSVVRSILWKHGVELPNPRLAYSRRFSARRT